MTSDATDILALCTKQARNDIATLREKLNHAFPGDADIHVRAEGLIAFRKENGLLHGQNHIANAPASMRGALYESALQGTEEALIRKRCFSR